MEARFSHSPLALYPYESLFFGQPVEEVSLLQTLELGRGVLLQPIDQWGNFGQSALILRTVAQLVWVGHLFTLVFYLISAFRARRRHLGVALN